MGQEFTINSADIEAKINQLLPSQGGMGAGIDFSASTMIIPTIDLTETAEGGTQRQDLQRSISHTSANTFDVANTTTTVLTTTGYYFVKACVGLRCNSSIEGQGQFILTDGVTDKVIYEVNAPSMNTVTSLTPFNVELDILLKAGDSFKITTNSNTVQIVGIYRQIADLSGTLVNP